MQIAYETGKSIGVNHPELCAGFQSDFCPKLKPAVTVIADVPRIWSSVNTRLYLKPNEGTIAGAVILLTRSDEVVLLEAVG